MSAAHETGEVSALVSQGHEHLERLRELLGHEAPPEVAAVDRAIAATRALRGSASLVGLDPFQHFLGRLFQLLDDVESHEVPWSASLDAVLREAERAEEALDAARAVEVPSVQASSAERQRSSAVLHRLESLESELRGLRAALQQAAPARESVGRQPVATAAAWPPLAMTSAAMPPVRPSAGAQPTGTSAADRLFASEPHAPTRFEDTRFPHFVGQPVGPIPDRVEVTYEGADGQQPEDLPESALLFEPEEEDDGQEPVLDLREFGAVEIRE